MKMLASGDRLTIYQLNMLYHDVHCEMLEQGVDCGSLGDTSLIMNLLSRKFTT